MDHYLNTTYRAGTFHSPVRENGKSLLTSLQLPWQRRTAKAIEHGNPGSLKLHLGCGNTYLSGWVNVDLARPGRKLDLKWDLRRGIPFGDHVAQSIFSEHLFEHIPLPGSLALLRACHRVLAPGGVLRIGVPDLEKYIESYVGDGKFIEEMRPGRPTRAVAMSEIFFFHQHRSAYDAETLILLMREAGFDHARHLPFGTSEILPVPDSEGRRFETLYVEGQVSNDAPRK